jgi:xanthine dehydrogenase accessory factor
VLSEKGEVVKVKEQWKELLSRLESGLPAALSVEAEGKSYIRRFQPRERLILLGGGHIALALHDLAGRLGFSVTVADDRREFASPGRFPHADEVICADFSQAIARLQVGKGDYVAVMTRGHRWDALCLRALLAGTEPRYLGMVASRKRGAALREQLAGEGFDPERLQRLRSPIGLDINALTVEEIALSIAAELVQVRRGDLPRLRGSKQLLQTEAEPEVLRFAADETGPRALVLVLETEGSTPVKSGAIMAVDENLRTAGTVGGGCAEGICIRRARGLMGTGKRVVLRLNLDQEPTENIGMACGGAMTVLLEDLG